MQAANYNWPVSLRHGNHITQTIIIIIIIIIAKHEGIILIISTSYTHTHTHTTEKMNGYIYLYSDLSSNHRGKGSHIAH